MCQAWERSEEFSLQRTPAAAKPTPRSGQAEGLRDNPRAPICPLLAPAMASCRRPRHCPSGASFYSDSHRVSRVSRRPLLFV